MAHDSTVAGLRLALLQQLFSDGVPSLWCPSLTHYDADGRIDAARIRAHLRHLTPHVKGFLIPGSTSDGWELNDVEFWEVLEIALDQAQKLELYLLVGLLKADANEALEALTKVLAHIKARTNESMQTKRSQRRACVGLQFAPHAAKLFRNRRWSTG